MTTYKQKLEDLVQTCITTARNSFMEAGAIPMNWIVEDKHGTRILITFTPDIPKDAVLTQMRKVAKDRDIVRYAVEFEAWMGVGDGPRPSERPERMEAIVVMGADRQNNSMLVSIEIERKGGKHYLGEATRSRNEDSLFGAFQIFEDTIQSGLG